MKRVKPAYFYVCFQSVDATTRIFFYQLCLSDGLDGIDVRVTSNTYRSRLFQLFQIRRISRIPIFASSMQCGTKLLSQLIKYLCTFFLFNTVKNNHQINKLIFVLKLEKFCILSIKKISIAKKIVCLINSRKL